MREDITYVLGLIGWLINGVLFLIGCLWCFGWMYACVITVAALLGLDIDVLGMDPMGVA